MATSPAPTTRAGWAARAAPVLRRRMLGQDLLRRTVLRDEPDQSPRHPVRSLHPLSQAAGEEILLVDAGLAEDAVAGVPDFGCSTRAPQMPELC